MLNNDEYNEQLVEGQIDMSQQQMEEQQLQFSDEEIQNLKEIFELFDKDRKGTINMKDLEAIMQSLQRNPEEAKEILRSIRMEDQ